MSLDPAEVVAKARELWPVLTEAVFPDTLALAWVPAALHIAGKAYRNMHLDAAAHVLAHFAYKNPATGLGAGGGGTGAATSIKTASLAVTFAGPVAGLPPSDAELATTAPGQVLLSLRRPLAATVPRWA